MDFLNFTKFVMNIDGSGTQFRMSHKHLNLT